MCEYVHINIYIYTQSCPILSAFLKKYFPRIIQSPLPFFLLSQHLLVFFSSGTLPAALLFNSMKSFKILVLAFLSASLTILVWSPESLCHLESPDPFQPNSPKSPPVLCFIIFYSFLLIPLSPKGTVTSVLFHLFWMLPSFCSCTTLPDLVTNCFQNKGSVVPCSNSMKRPNQRRVIFLKTNKKIPQNLLLKSNAVSFHYFFTRLEIINFITTVSVASEGLPLKKLTPKQLSSFDGYKKSMQHPPVSAK